MSNSDRESIHFVTGRLAESAVREIVAHLSATHPFDYSIAVMPITVAALMTPQWLMRHLTIPDDTTRILLPGYLEPHLDAIRSLVPIRVDCGPKDIRDLPLLFGKKRHKSDDYGAYSIEVIAEINYAPRRSIAELQSEALRWIADGADRIDLGCEPGVRWQSVSDGVKSLIDLGTKVSIDSFDPWEVSRATEAGASLVLSVNSQNRAIAVDWGVEVVAIPDEPNDFQTSMVETAQFLSEHSIPFRLDPILEPIGCGFSTSLGRYLKTRTLFPEAPMMMGIGNLTELTDCDSAGVNTLLLGFCEEQQIHSVLTTEVIPWAKSSVRECDLARRLVCYAVRHRIPPKHLEERLIMLRDPSDAHPTEGSLQAMAANIKDNNYRIAIDGQQIHLISAGVHLRGEDPFKMIDELMALPESRNVDASHAFYLGFELAKALTALTLNKRYEQDEALRWGMHTRPEKHHRLTRSKARDRN